MSPADCSNPADRVTVARREPSICPELVRDRERVSADAVVAHQRPAAQTLLVRMQPVARGRLRDLPEGAWTYFCTSPRNPGRPSRPLMNSPASIRNVRPPTWEIARTARGSTRNQWHPDDALVADGRHLDDVAVGERRDQRDHAVDGEVDEGDGLARSKSTVFTVRCAGRRCSISAFRSTSGSASRRWLAAGAARTLPFAIRPFVRLPQRPHCGNFSEPPWENRWPSRCSSG